MKKIIIPTSTALLALALASTANAVTLVFEDFEDGTLTYTQSTPDFSDGNFDYFGRVADANTTFPSINGTSIFHSQINGEITNKQGDGYFGSNDIQDAVSSGTISPTQTLTFGGINITNYENLSFDGLFAVGYDADGLRNASNILFVEYQIDGGGYTKNFQLAPGAGNNLFVDTNFDGTGDGTQIGNAFTEYTAGITGTGSSLDLRISMSSNSGGQDFALDNVTITGTAIPEPSAALLGSLGILALLRRRR